MIGGAQTSPECGKSSYHGGAGGLGAARNWIRELDYFMQCADVLAKRAFRSSTIDSNGANLFRRRRRHRRDNNGRHAAAGECLSGSGSQAAPLREPPADKQTTLVLDDSGRTATLGSVRKSSARATQTFAARVYVRYLGLIRRLEMISLGGAILTRQRDPLLFFREDAFRGIAQASRKSEETFVAAEIFDRPTTTTREHLKSRADTEKERACKR